jgi:ppGpp synthetase/RelA/SpoT-type nucleotidyltranferase
MSESAQKPTKEEFMRWSDSKTCGTFTASIQQWYESSQSNLLSRIQDTDFFCSLSKELEAAASKYNEATNTKLFSLNRRPEIAWNKKTYASFAEKIYRHNCLDNNNFPDPPVDGWITLENSYEKIDDIIRTTLVVAYADAPAFLSEKILQSAKTAGMKSYSKDHAKEKGYYAHHVYIDVPVPIASLTRAGDYREFQVPVEIQITTELQGALREITHVLYEKERLSGGPGDRWKHEFDSERFRAAYMAHSLRFIEAMIVDLRGRIQPERNFK